MEKRRVNVKKKAILAAAACLMLTGCSGGVTLGIEGLIAAPNFLDEQSVIHEALISSVGKNVTLKYPKNGENRSAFLIGNIDRESGEEALVFYEINNASAVDSGIRINVLDKTGEDTWESVYDLAGKGTDIDRVDISALGTDGIKNIIIGYSAMSIEEKTLQVAAYDRRAFNPSRFEDVYSMMELFDIDKDGYDEIVTVYNNSAELSVQASLIQSDGKDIVKTDSVAMASDTVSFANCTVGLSDEETPALFVDCAKNNGELQTEIIYYKYGKLQNPCLQITDKLLAKTTRPAGYYSKDIDGDDIVEIPSTELMPGHESLAEEERVLLTNWWTYNDYYTLEMKYSGYYSISDGYAMMFPKRWQGNVTVKTDTASGEMVFYKYEGDAVGYMTELMRIKVCSISETEQYTFDGYTVIGSRDQTDYLVKLSPDRSEPLVLTWDELENSFYIVD